MDRYAGYAVPTANVASEMIGPQYLIVAGGRDTDALLAELSFRFVCRQSAGPSDRAQTEYVELSAYDANSNAFPANAHCASIWHEWTWCSQDGPVSVVPQPHTSSTPHYIAQSIELRVARGTTSAQRTRTWCAQYSPTLTVEYNPIH